MYIYIHTIYTIHIYTCIMETPLRYNYRECTGGIREHYIRLTIRLYHGSALSWNSDHDHDLNPYIQCSNCSPKNSRTPFSSHCPIQFQPWPHDISCLFPILLFYGTPQSRGKPSQGQQKNITKSQSFLGKNMVNHTPLVPPQESVPWKPKKTIEMPGPPEGAGNTIFWQPVACL